MDLLQDFVLDFERLDREIAELPFRSVKGTTGTQASFLELFDGDHAKCRELEKRVASAMGFDNVIYLSGQTYSRKIDYFVLSILSGLAQSAAKMNLSVPSRSVPVPWHTNAIPCAASASALLPGM